MQIVVPMAGNGIRFKKAGYSPIKPLIKIHKKPMISYVIELFPNEIDFVYICNKKHLAEKKLKSELQKIKPSGFIVPISYKKNGPVYGINLAKKYISDDKPTIVNYCDFTMLWNYDAFKNFL